MSPGPSDGLDRFEDESTNLAFRRTFLEAYPAEMVPALVTTGRWLYDLALAYGRPSGEFSLVSLLRAALEDLKHLRSVFDFLGNERKQNRLEGDDLEVSRFAPKLLSQTARLIGRIESRIAQLESTDMAEPSNESSRSS